MFFLCYAGNAANAAWAEAPVLGQRGRRRAWRPLVVFFPRLIALLRSYAESQKFTRYET